MGKRPLTPFGKDIKRRLVDLDRNQTWLMEEVRKRTGLYFDSSYLYKITTGVNMTPKIVHAICETLNIRPPTPVNQPDKPKST